MMKFHFDSSQEYQLKAIQSVIDIFKGQPLEKGLFDVSVSQTPSGLAYSQSVMANNLVLSEEKILENIRTIQTQNGIKKLSEKIELCEYEIDGQKYGFPYHFTVEMETGTGKTYTYLRTIYELNKVYGFKKFVIVVPSVAIREGVIKNLQITHQHLQGLYGNPPLKFMMYDSSKLGSLSTFASSNHIQILIINIDSFNKDKNIINTEREQGIKPIEHIRNTNPIVIVDEPQNFDGKNADKAKSALHELNPLCTLRYSATHRNFYNLVYSLNPVQAYDLGLVKRIEVNSIQVGKGNTAINNTDFNGAYIRLAGFTEGKKLQADLIIHEERLFDVREKKIKVKIGDNLYALSGGRSSYKDGYIVKRIYNVAEGSENFIEFTNQIKVHLYEETGKISEEAVKYQIERAVEVHFEKEYRYWTRGGNTGDLNNRIKVLTLFFIDRVQNYRVYEDDNVQKGKYALWFEEIFEKKAQEYLPKYEN